jgi:hypothetical protein
MGRLWIVILISMSLLMACGKVESTKKAIDSLGDDEFEYGSANQAPRIICDIWPEQDTSRLRRIDSIDEFDTFADNIEEGELVHFDCQQTTDEDAVDDLVFALDINYNPDQPDFAATAGFEFETSVSQAGRYPMAVLARDLEGKESIKTFTLVVECLDKTPPSLNLSGVSVTAQSRLNYFTYSINPADVSGGDGFTFSWDFNGDKTYDPVSLDPRSERWTTDYSVSDVYTIFAAFAPETRTVGLRVRNACQQISHFDVPLSFEIPNIDRTPVALAEVRDYWYIQADIASSPTSNQRRNGDVILTQYPDENDMRIDCSYNKKRFDQPAVFTMEAYSWYDSDNKDVDSHGLEIKVNNINDDLSVGQQVFTDANLTVAKYEVSEQGDAFAKEIFSKDSQCSIRIVVIRTDAITPCASDETHRADFEEGSEALQILGEYDCPALRINGGSAQVEARNGKFFCEVDSTNQCVGGGGGGGGGEPPDPL